MQSKPDVKHCTGVNLVQQCLPFMRTVGNKEEFLVALLRGIGSGMQDVELLREFCEYVSILLVNC